MINEDDYRIDEERGLVVDGICGPQTWAALVEADHRLGDRMLYLRSPMTRGDDVTELQRRLGSLGFDAGWLDGIFGPDTEAAVRDFQHNQGLTADGVVGRDTVHSLERISGRITDDRTVAAVREVERLRALEEMVEIMKRMWSEEKASFEGTHFSVHEAVCEPKPERLPEILIGGGGEKVLMGIAARHADVWNNMAVFQAQLGAKVDALRRRCDEVGRDFDSIEISQQCVVVIAEDDDRARAALEKAKKIYGGHMGAHLEEHGIWGAPDAVIERIERHRALGCSSFVVEFFGRDTREPAQLFAEKVMPAFG